MFLKYHLHCYPLPLPLSIHIIDSILMSFEFVTSNPLLFGRGLASQPTPDTDTVAKTPSSALVIMVIVVAERPTRVVLQDEFTLKQPLCLLLHLICPSNATMSSTYLSRSSSFAYIIMAQSLPGLEITFCYLVTWQLELLPSLPRSNEATRITLGISQERKVVSMMPDHAIGTEYY